MNIISLHLNTDEDWSKIKVEMKALWLHWKQQWDHCSVVVEENVIFDLVIAFQPAIINDAGN